MKLIKKNPVIGTAFLIAFCLLPTNVFAHHVEWMHLNPFMQGLSMPIHGLDHMIVTLGVGLLAVQLGGRALWATPVSFALLLLIGGILNIYGIPIPFVEQLILASVILVGALLLISPRWPLFIAISIVALFATSHGNVLISEAPHNGWFLLFVIGCLLAAFILLGCGMGLGFLLQKTLRPSFIRYAGVVIITIGCVIFLFPKSNELIIYLLE